MKSKTIKRTISYMLSICCVFAFVVFFKPQNVYASYKRYVTASSLTVRKKASSKGKIKGYYKKGTKVTCYKKKGSWTRVKYGSHKYYVATKYLSTKKPVVSATGSVANYGSTSYSTVSKGQQVVNYAMQFKGNPYKWGGENLYTGVDCSGFTMKVFQYFGYYLPHSSISQRSYGTAVSWSNKQVGDLICYNAINGIGHVGIYIGNNQVIHAGSTATGIHISTANYRSVNCVRRIVK